MFDWNHFKKTKVYQEAFEEGTQQWKLEAVPKLLEQGLSIEQIAEALSLDVETVRQAAQQQSS